MDIIIICDIVFIIGIRFMQELLLKRMQENLSLPDKIKRLWFYSLYLLIRNIGHIKTLALGNYRVSYGYGLVINTDFGMGKTATLSTLGNKSRGIRKHSSTDEYNYFQGMAVSYKLAKRWTLDGFYSYRKMDGIVDNQFIRSLKKMDIIGCIVSLRRKIH